jgi:flavodoxin
MPRDAPTTAVPRGVRRRRGNRLSSWAVNIVVTYNSRTGNTQRAAELIAGASSMAGVDNVVVFPVERANEFFSELAEADLVFVGTWTDGLILFGHRPGGAAKIRDLPKLWNKRVAAFATYAVKPGDITDKFAALLERQGATVITSAALHRKRLETEVTDFVADSLSSI